ncbi:[citrate (pro-3S)-lyase] ligase [Fructilactobacillus vespulae]|uniref:[citrate (pro-3S)-lyase] ligase n=1 Tax=Fructilactobacillus vespulae TaxID=1249630 RepID=UPI0039B626E1
MTISEPEIREINLFDSEERADWQSFLTDVGIDNFSDSELDPLDGTIGLFKDDHLVATGSYAGNILKYIGVCHKDPDSDGYFNKVVSTLLTTLAQRGIFHTLVFTKPKYSKSFQFIGFSELAKSDDVAFLETGDQSITSYLSRFPKFSDDENIGAIVMNANPFTKGHRYLIEQAAQQCSGVYVLIVSTDKSLFKTKERFELVQAGVSDLENVKVVYAGDYAVSAATFPAYFLNSSNDKIVSQTTIDALVFRNFIAKELKVKTRFLGSEPESRTTNIYNEVLTKTLPPQVAVKVIDRVQAESGKIISARTVRQAIAADKLAEIKTLVPPTTYQFIEQNQETLQERIERGMKINGN